MKKLSRKHAPDFFAFARAATDELIRDGRLGTSQTYTKSLRSFASFLRSEGMFRETEEISFPMDLITGDLICRYNGYLASRGVIRNSVSFYNRTLRAIYNKAVRRFNASDTLPFRDVYTGIDKTRSRAIDEKQVARLAGLKFGGNKNLEVARDLFIFSYATRGMSFVDMAYLRKSNVKGNYIIYSRKKSGARMEVKIEPPVAKIIRKYGDGGSEYLLPILQELKSLDEQSDSSFRSREYRRYQSGLSAYNRTLKQLSEMIGGDHLPLSSYVSRHSWATAAHNKSISMSLISEGLGHTNEKTTRIYLGRMDGKMLDRANGEIVKNLRKFVSMKETDSPTGRLQNSLLQWIVKTVVRKK